MPKKVKPKKKNRDKMIFCDPAVCNHCLYMGEGDFFCDKVPDFVCVMSGWDVTENFMWCVYGSWEEYCEKGLNDGN